MLWTMNAENRQAVTAEQSKSESWQDRFNRVHGRQYPALPGHPQMLFAGVLNDADDVRKTRIILNATPRPKVDPREN